MSAPITVWSMAAYLTTTEGLTWRQDDWTANRIVKALKGQPFNGYFQVTIQKKTYKFYQNTVGQFMPSLYGALAHKLNELFDEPFDLVPIPNSTAVVGSDADFHTHEHAREVASKMNSKATVIPALRWKAAKKPAHEGGSRDPQIHFQNLETVIQPTQRVVLYDDVLTTGSQMVAACRRLAQTTAMPILGIVVGRTVNEQKPDPISWQSETIETAEIPFDWNAFLSTAL